MTSVSSLMKTSVYLVETVVSDLFIVRIYPKVFSLDAPCTDRVVPPVVSVLCCMERKHPHHRSSSPSIYRRHRYASPSSPMQSYTERHFSAPPPGTGIGAVYTLSLLGHDIVFSTEQERITNSFFSCTLALNAVCTGPSYIAFADVRTKF